LRNPLPIAAREIAAALHTAPDGWKKAVAAACAGPTIARGSEGTGHGIDPVSPPSNRRAYPATRGFPAVAFARTASLPASSWGNIMSSATTAAPRSRMLSDNLPTSARGHGHRPNCSKLFSSISTMTTSPD